MTTAYETAVIGLGAMGHGMAASCLRAGLRTYGFDVVPAHVERFVAAGGETGPFQEIAPTLDAAVIVVLNAEQTEDVLFGASPLVPQMKPGAVVLACATVAPEFARAMAARCGEYGVHYLDAPVSGGTGRAAQGALSIMAAGTGAAFDAARPALDAMAETVFEMGEEAGAGSAMKAINQMLVGIHIAATAEALTFGMTQGVDPETFTRIIPKCAGTSWALEDRAPHIVAGDYTPLSQVNIWPKDLGIVLDIAKSAQFSAPVTAAAMQQFLAAAGMGLGREDDAAVARVYARNAGLTLPGEA